MLCIYVCVSVVVSVLCGSNMHLGITRSEMESKTNPDKLSVHPTRNLLSIAFYIEMQCIHPTTAHYPCPSYPHALIKRVIWRPGFNWPKVWVAELFARLPSIIDGGNVAIAGTEAGVADADDGDFN